MSEYFDGEKRCLQNNTQKAEEFPNKFKIYTIPIVDLRVSET